MTVFQRWAKVIDVGLIGLMSQRLHTCFIVCEYVRFGHFLYDRVQRVCPIRSVVPCAWGR